MIKYEFIISDESDYNILDIIRHEIIKLRYENQTEDRFSQAEKNWFKDAANALEEDYNIILKGRTKIS